MATPEEENRSLVPAPEPTALTPSQRLNLGIEKAISILISSRGKVKAPLASLLESPNPEIRITILRESFIRTVDELVDKKIGQKDFARAVRTVALMGKGKDLDPMLSADPHEGIRDAFLSLPRHKLAIATRNLPTRQMIEFFGMCDYNFCEPQRATQYLANIAGKIYGNIVALEDKPRNDILELNIRTLERKLLLLVRRFTSRDDEYLLKIFQKLTGDSLPFPNAPMTLIILDYLRHHENEELENITRIFWRKIDRITREKSKNVLEGDASWHVQSYYENRFGDED